MASRETSPNNLENKNTSIINLSYSQPIRVNQNANDTLSIIDSNHHEENPLIIQETNHVKDDNNNVLDNVNEVKI